MDSTALDDSCDVLEGQNADKGGGVASNTAGSNINNNNNNNNNNKARFIGIDRTQKLGILVCVVLTIVVGVVIAIVILLPSNGNDNDNNSNNNLNLNSQATTNTSAPSTVPTLSPAPSFVPSTSPTMAPTVPELGCRGDRFDNEGNQEKNNRLFAGQFICSDDADQRYRFGIDPATGNLMTLDFYTNQIRTYYHNDYHKQQQQKQQQQLERRLDALNKTNNTSSTNETTILQQENDNDDGDCNGWIPPEEEFGDTESESVSVSKSSHHPNCTERQAETMTKDTQSPTCAPTSTTYLDYYFSVSTQAAFRIHRVSRTEDYEIVDQVLHWELPTTYNISLVYQNCLKTHDCPYLHLHQDGVIVLAWLDFRLNSYDGWMEKNIRRCYEFNTTDQL